MINRKIIQLFFKKLYSSDFAKRFYYTFNPKKATIHPKPRQIMFEFEIGGNEIKPYASEAIIEIPHNRTLLAQKLTDSDPLQPELVTGLKTVEEVFAHFKPNVNVEFETEEGALVRENLMFSNLGDYAIKNVTQQSPYLRTLNAQAIEYQKISRQLKGNKILRSILEKEDGKAALLGALQALIQELEDNESKMQ